MQQSNANITPGDARKAARHLCSFLRQMGRVRGRQDYSLDYRWRCENIIRKSLVVTFVCGTVSHAFIWLLMLGFSLSRLCEESECWSLIILDVPASALYAESNYSVTYGSLIFGSVWWGILWVLLYSLFLHIKSGFTAIINRN